MKNVFICLCLTILLFLSFLGNSFRVASTDVFEIDGTCLIAYHGTDTDVIVPAGITAIGDRCFAFCTEIEQVVLPDGLTSIGDCAFLHCTSLKSVSLPDSVSKIGEGTFSYCLALESLHMPDSLQRIGSGAFALCNSLPSVSLPQHVTEIGSKAFMGCGALRSVALPDSLTTISEGTFTGCPALETVALPAALNEIGAHAFSGCSALTSLSLPDGLNVLGSGAFSGCSALSSLTLPSQLTAVPDDLCENCTSLSTVTLPEGITAIGSKAFSGCALLKDLLIPADVTAIGKDCFFGCESLLSQCSSEGHTVLYNGRLLLGIEEGISVVTIPAGTELLADGVLDSPQLIAVTIPGTVLYCGIQSPENLIEIRGVPGSAAAQFAEERQITFADVGEIRTGIPTEIIYGTDTWSIQNAGFEFGSEYYLTDAARADLESSMLSGGATVDKDWTGECFGLCSAMLLLKAGIYTPEQIQPGAETVSDITSDRAVQSFLNFYHFTQYTPELMGTPWGYRYTGQAIWKTVQTAKECNTGAPPFLISLKLGHAVIGYGQEDGSWEIDGESYDGRILIWDPNFPTAPNADADIYYDSETLRCCIPYYHVQCDAMETHVPITGLCREPATLNSHPYPFDHRMGDVNRDGEVRISDAVMLAHIIAEDAGAGITTAGLYSADCNNDGLIQLVDMRVLLKQLI